MFNKLWQDEHGVILSAELVLVASILTLGMVVGMVELQCAVMAEVQDIAEAFGNLNQSYTVSGFTSSKGANQFKARTHGAKYSDSVDVGEAFCHRADDIVCSDPGEQAK